MSFEVASIRQSKGAFSPPSFPLDAGDAYRPTGGLFKADFPLVVYIQFAYKVRFTPEQMRSMLALLPKWVANTRFSIQARAEGNPTKDQMRLMMQSLLADRFQLAVHFETQEVPVFALTLVKPDKTGPNLRPHSEGPPCNDPAASPANGSRAISTGVFPPVCDAYMMAVQPNRLSLLGSRNTTMALLAAGLPSLGRPLVDKTGLSGKFDFVIEWTLETNGPVSPGADVPPDSQRPTLLQALREQLGLKLELTKGPVQILVVDHVESPSEN